MELGSKSDTVVNSGATDKVAPDNTTNEIKTAPIAVESKVERQYLHFGVPVRLGSRVIEVRQVPKFSLLPKGNEAKSVREEQVKKIGSQWKRGTRDVIRGLSEEEEQFYLPRLLGVSAKSDEWNEKVLNHWLDFGFDIPFSDPVDLQVGFKEVKGVVEPIDLLGYMRYKFCIENSDVATSEIDLNNPFHKSFYIVDKAKAIIDDETKFAKMKNINRVFDQLIAATDTSTKNKIQWILETAGGEDGTGIDTTHLSEIQKEMELEKFKNRNADKFAEVVNDSNIETKALIRKSVEKGNLTQEGNAIFFGQKVIGNTLLEAVGYLNNPVNQNDKLIIIARNKTAAE